MIKLPALSQVLAYENISIINRFCFENPETSAEQAQQIFQDLLAWLWLCVSRKQRQLNTHMIGPLAMLDKMWHVFILHTQSYAEFCQQYFNYFLHHEVEPIGNEYVMPTEELSIFLSDSYDHLGEAWLLRNFS